MKYDYRKAIKEDVKDYIEWNKADYEGMDREELEEKLNNELWIADSVTGNASGSYTFNRAKAREYVEPNMALAVEALREFGYDMDHFGKKLDDEEWEYLDVTIRCYLLGQAINEVLDELEDK